MGGIVAQGAFADLFQRLLAEDMLCLAGVLGGGLLVHAQLHKEVIPIAIIAVGVSTATKRSKALGENVIIQSIGACS